MKRNRLPALLSAAILMLGAGAAALPASLTAFADETIASGSVTDSMQWSLDSNGVLTVAGSGIMPAFSYSYQKYRYETPWADHKDAIRSVVIADGVENVSDFAFIHCSSVQTVQLSDTVREIGMYAFSRIGAKEIVLPESVEKINPSAFFCCENLSKITITNPACSIAQGEGTICNSYFSDMDEDTGEIVWESYRFGGTIFGAENSTAQKYAAKCHYAFRVIGSVPDPIAGSCGEQAEYLFDPDTEVLTVTGTGAITAEWKKQNIRTVKQVILSDGISNVPDSAFSQYAMLKEAVLPESITEIGYDAFRDCAQLEQIVLPEQVSRIQDGAFSNCAGLQKITILNPACRIADACDTDDPDAYSEYVYVGHGSAINSRFVGQTMEELTLEWRFDGVICGYSGSTAEAYAMNYCKFESLGDAPFTETTTTAATTTANTTTTTTTTAATTTTEITTTTISATAVTTTVTSITTPAITTTTITTTAAEHHDLPQTGTAGRKNNALAAMCLLLIAGGALMTASVRGSRKES